MNSKLIAILSRVALLVTAIVWGSSLVVISAVKDAFMPNMLLALRFSLACLLLGLIFFPKFKLLNKEYWISGLIIGFFLFIAYSSQTTGVTSAAGAPGRSGFISASYCVLVPFLTWLFTGERPDRYNLIAAVLCIGGLFFVFYTELASSMNASLSAGDLYALISGVLFAVHIVAISKWGNNKDPILITILQFLFATIFSLTTSLIFEKPSFSTISPKALFALLYLSILCTALALLFQDIGQKYTPSSTAALILGTESIFSIVFAVLFAGEKLTRSSVIGFILIFLAIIVSETKLDFIKSKKKTS